MIPPSAACFVQSVHPSRPVVCIQGLGFVGAAMAAAVASARDGDGEPRFSVIGIDLDHGRGAQAIAAINDGRFPFATEDPQLEPAIAAARAAGNLVATSDAAAYGLADVVVVDIHLDVQGELLAPQVDFSNFRKAIATIGAHVRPGALVLVETTVPPGTCAHVAAPELAQALGKRGLPADCVHLAHSYERVMPGPGYYDSIVNFWRVYSGHTEAAAERCRRFLEAIIDTDRFPLTRLDNTTASETAKVLENSYRATTIAFMEEWGRFAEAVGIDLFQIVDAIRVRPTHNNMRTPGFGVGGYCLTKDPLLAKVGAHTLFGRTDLDFPFCTQAIAANRAMPLVSVAHLRERLGELSGRSILLLGISYRPGVADTRYSPSEVFARAVQESGARLVCHDPLVRRWEEMALEPLAELPDPSGFDAVIFAVGHDVYQRLDLPAWLGSARPLILDANGVLTHAQRQAVKALGVPLASIGRGE